MTKLSLNCQLSIVHCQLSIALLCVLLTGCRKDLCYDHDEHSIAVKVHIDAAWEQEWERTEEIDWEALWCDEWSYAYDELRPEVAEGIRAIVYETEGSTYNLHNLSPEGGRLPMGEGTHPLLFYNNDTEYIVFNDLPSSATATASTRTRTRAGFAELHAGERTITPPDMLYGAYIDAYEAQLALETDTVPLTLRPLTYTYLVRYEFKAGQKYVALARGALAGMAESVYLSDGHTGDEAATVMFDATLTDWGAEAQVQSFGVPNYPGDHYTRADGTAAHYALNLEVRLNNGKMLNYEFDVTGQVEGQPRGGVITVSGIEVSDEDGQGGSGAFDVEVDGWGDYIDIPLPL